MNVSDWCYYFLAVECSWPPRSSIVEAPRATVKSTRYFQGRMNLTSKGVTRTRDSTLGRHQFLACHFCGRIGLPKRHLLSEIEPINPRWPGYVCNPRSKKVMKIIDSPFLVVRILARELKHMRVAGRSLRLVMLCMQCS